jgi:hypothetical protein
MCIVLPSLLPRGRRQISMQSELYKGLGGYAPHFDD